MAKLDSLIVDLKLETAELRKGLDDATAKLGTFGSMMTSVVGLVSFEKIGRMALHAAAQVGEFVLAGAETADRLGKLAGAAQVPVETFQRLAFAARLGGVSTEEFGGTFAKFNKTLGEAATGSKKQVAIFGALGIAIKDASGHSRNSGDIFRDVAVKLSELESGFGKAKLEQDIFGKSGGDLDETLQNVADGMADVGGEADKFGAVLDGQAIAAATAFNDNIDRMKVAVDGVAMRVAGNLAPALVELTNQFTQSKDTADGFRATADVLTGAIRVVASVLIHVVGKFREMGVVVAGIAVAINALAEDDFTKAVGAMEAMSEGLVEVEVQTAQQLAAVWDDQSAAHKEVADKHEKDTDAIIRNIEKRMKAEDEAATRAKEAGDLAKKLFAEHVKESEQAFKSTEITEAGIAKGEEYGRIGAGPADVTGHLKSLTAGFDSFQDALDQNVTAQIGINAETAAMADAKAAFDKEGFDLASEALQNHKGIAAKSAAALGAFSALAESAEREAKEITQAMTQAIGGMVSNLNSKLGELGQVINSAISGFQSGGVWGALVAVILEVFSRWVGFAEIQQKATDQLAGFIEDLGPGLEMLGAGFGSLMDALSEVTDVVAVALNPILAAVGHVLGILGEALGPIFELIENIIGPITAMAPLFMMLATILNPLTYVLKLVGVLFEVIGVGFGYLGFALQKAAGWVLEQLRQLASILGLNDIALKVGALALQMNKNADAAKAKADAAWTKLGTFDLFADKPDKKIDTLNDELDTTAKGVGKLGDESVKAAKGMDKLSRQLTNVPEGFRTLAREFEATSPTMTKVRLGGIGGADRAPGIHIHTNSVTTTIADLVRLMQEAMAKGKFQKRGAQT